MCNLFSSVFLKDVHPYFFIDKQSYFYRNKVKYVYVSTIVTLEFCYKACLTVFLFYLKKKIVKYHNIHTFESNYRRAF